MKNIATLTLNPAIDKSFDIERVLPERKLRGTNPRFDPGGGGINVSRAIAKLGGTSAAVYCGGGLEGDLLQGLLKAEGQDQRRVPVAGITRESLTVNETSTGLQYRFSAPGPNEFPNRFHPVELTACPTVVKANMVIWMLPFSRRRRRRRTAPS